MAHDCKKIPDSGGAWYLLANILLRQLDGQYALNLKSKGWASLYKQESARTALLRLAKAIREAVDDQGLFAPCDWIPRQSFPPGDVEDLARAILAGLEEDSRSDRRHTAGAGWLKTPAKTYDAAAVQRAEELLASAQAALGECVSRAEKRSRADAAVRS